jgi:hypothetical protein
LPPRRKLQARKFAPELLSGERERLAAIADDPAEPNWKRLRAAVLLHSAAPMPPEGIPARRQGTEGFRPVNALSRDQVAACCRCSASTVTAVCRRYAEAGIEAVLTQGKGKWERDWS